MRWMFCTLLIMNTAGAWAQLQPEVNWERYNKIRRQQQKEAPAPALEWPHRVRPLPLTKSKLADTLLTATAGTPLRKLGSNAYGDVYALPQDNMPLLRPAGTGTLRMPTLVPTADSSAAGQMPNGLQVQRYRFRK
ncbi:MAG: hypothetical protein MUF62_05415 [Chitinophagaceae bacterium]|nr:hypothetical protein [Chitinophagaceae bacterium]